jgi:prepilin-type N-terminal cleavage/methylation domain-containing protein
MHSRKGFSLIEILVSVAIMATIGVAMLAAMSTSSKVLIRTDSYETARDLAVSQMEYVKQLAWNDSAYAKDSSIIPTGYDAAINVETLQTENANSTLQKITVIVTRDGSEVTRLQDYRVSPYGFGE